MKCNANGTSAVDAPLPCLHQIAHAACSPWCGISGTRVGGTQSGSGTLAVEAPLPYLHQNAHAACSPCGISGTRAGGRAVTRSGSTNTDAAKCRNSAQHSLTAAHSMGASGGLYGGYRICGLLYGDIYIYTNTCTPASRAPPRLPPVRPRPSSSTSTQGYTPIFSHKPFLVYSTAHLE